jgi:hypothetical protein
MFVQVINCYLPREMRGFGMFVGLFVVELTNGVVTGMQVTVNVDG